MSMHRVYKVFQKRQEQVLRVLQPFEEKLHCLCDEAGQARLQHPLSPAVRTWHLSPFRIQELLPDVILPKELQKKKSSKSDKHK